MSSLRFTFASADAHPVRTVYTFTSPPVVLRLWTVRLRPKSLLTYGGPRSPPLSGTRSAACTKNPQCGTPPAPCRELVREEGPTVATTAPPLSPEPGPHEPHSHKRGAKRSAAVVHVAQVLDAPTTIAIARKDSEARKAAADSERQAGRPTLCKSTGSDAQVHRSAPGQSACNDCTHRLHGTMHATLNTTLTRHRANSAWQRLHAAQSGQQCTTLISARLHTSQTSNACSLPNLTEH